MTAHQNPNRVVVLVAIGIAVGLEVPMVVGVITNKLGVLADHASGFMIAAGVLVGILVGAIVAGAVEETTQGSETRKREDTTMELPISHAEAYRRAYATTLPPLPQYRVSRFWTGFTAGVLAAFTAALAGAALCWAVL